MPWASSPAIDLRGDVRALDDRFEQSIVVGQLFSGVTFWSPPTRSIASMKASGLRRGGLTVSATRRPQA
jgi:hypothetical protein